MIRIALIAISFLAVTITLILVQPSAPRLDMAETPTTPDAQVTRSDTDFEALAAVSASIAGQTAAEPALETPERSTSSDVAALPEQTPEPLDSLLPENSAARVTDAPKTASALEQLIIGALQQGQSEDYIDALVNDAAEKGKVEVPGALVTVDGRVDTATLLTVLSAAPEAMRAGGQIYTVQPGDSLASISYRFFGTTERHTEIFEANRETMGAPGNIRVGQDLVIPAR